MLLLNMRRRHYKGRSQTACTSMFTTTTTGVVVPGVLNFY